MTPKLIAEADAILLYALRYAIGRQTHAPHDVIHAIRAALPIEHQGTRAAMIREIEERVQQLEFPDPYALGNPTIDAPGWLLLLDELHANAKSERILL